MMKAISADTFETLRNRDRLRDNKNLLYWYKTLFKHQFDIAGVVPEAGKNILEIGSGTSPLKLFHSQVFTSDIMKLDYLDFQFDAHEMNTCEALEGKEFDLIMMTNVLHHLKDPLLFLENASKKLRAGGKIVFTEPYYSLLSIPIYKCLHHEPSDFSINYPVLGDITGPLSTANMAMPQMIFFQRKDWLAKLQNSYDLKSMKVSFFTGLAYFATGGISRQLPFPRAFYPMALALDQIFSKFFPKLWASFSTIVLVRKS